VAYKKNIFFLNVSLGGLKVKKDFTQDWDFKKGERLSVAIAELAWGSPLMDNLQWKITPYAGLAVTEVAGKAENDKRGWDRFFPVVGLHADYKLRKKIDLNPSIFGKELATTSIRLRAYMTYMNLSQSRGGLVFNFCVSLAGFGQMIRLINDKPAQINN
jgi:hypothetical protein